MQDSTVNLILLDLAGILSLCNAPWLFGAIAAGIFRFLRNREHAQLKAELRCQRENMMTLRTDTSERVRLAEMAAGHRAKIEDARRVMLALLAVQATQGSMSLVDAKKARMSRPEWTRARHLLLLAGVAELNGNGEARLIVSPFDARARVTAYLAGLKDASNYVFP